MLKSFWQLQSSSTSSSPPPPSSSTSSDHNNKFHSKDIKALVSHQVAVVNKDNNNTNFCEVGGRCHRHIQTKQHQSYLKKRFRYYFKKSKIKRKVKKDTKNSDEYENYDLNVCNSSDLAIAGIANNIPKTDENWIRIKVNNEISSSTYNNNYNISSGSNSNINCATISEVSIDYPSELYRQEFIEKSIDVPDDFYQINKQNLFKFKSSKSNDDKKINSWQKPETIHQEFLKVNNKKILNFFCMLAWFDVYIIKKCI